MRLAVLCLLLVGTVWADSQLVLTVGPSTVAQRDALVRVLRGRMRTESLTVEWKGDRKLILTADKFEPHLTDPGVVSFRIGKSSLVLGPGDVEARAVIDQDPSVLRINLHEAATRRLADFTAAGVGHPLALYLDDQLVWSTTLRAPIHSGELSLTLSISDSDLVRIARIMSLGPLPIPIANGTAH